MSGHRSPRLRSGKLSRSGFRTHRNGGASIYAAIPLEVSRIRPMYQPLLFPVAAEKGTSLQPSTWQIIRGNSESRQKGGGRRTAQPPVFDAIARDTERSSSCRSKGL